MKSVRLVFSCLCLLALAACNLNAPLVATITPANSGPATQIPFPSLAPETTSADTAVPAKPTALATSTPKIVPTAGSTVAPTQKLPTPVPTTVPTKVPTTAPTVVPTTVPTKVPTKAPTVVPTTVSTKVPTLAATATASGFPKVPEAILILVPGPNSTILSPVTISGMADPSFEQSLVAKVTGENGLSIANKATTIQAEAGKRGKFQVEISFKIAKDQSGRVAAWTISAKDGGLIHFTSQDVLLKMNGTASIKGETDQYETLLITKPAPAAAVSGGKLVVQGWSAPVFENTINVVLCGEGGTGKKDIFCGTADNVLARATVIINAPDAGQPGPFSITLNYKVSRTVNGRVAVYFTSPRDGGLLHLSSVPVQLKP
jgi:hypothetical protein